MVTYLSDSNSEKWYCLTTLPKKERLAAGCITQRMGFEAFAPCHYFVRKTPTGKKRFLEALFPCYIFIRCDIRPHFRQILSMNGVRGVVRYGNDIPTIDAGFVETLREELERRGPEAAEPPLDVGAIVEVVSGPFKTFTARVLACPDSACRVACLLEVLGRPIEIKLSKCDLFVSKMAEHGTVKAVNVV